MDKKMDNLCNVYNFLRDDCLGRPPKEKWCLCGNGRGQWWNIRLG